MNLFLNQRAVSLAKYIIKTGQTVRQTAVVYGISKSTVHNDVSIKLRKIDAKLYEKASVILAKNFQEKHLRGGESTRKKYLLKNNLAGKIIKK